MKDFIKEPFKKTKILFEKLDKIREEIGFDEDTFGIVLLTYTQGLLHKLGEKIRR